MVATATPVASRTSTGSGGQGAVGDPGRPAAWRWALAALLGSSAALVVAALVAAGGTFVYPLDDPAIHLTVARRLAYDGTWGIVAGEYQAASSSPLWTLLLAPTQWLIRGTAGELVPLGLNLVAGVWVLRLLRDDLAAVLRPGRGRPLDGAALVALVVALLFLPGLALLGMEHTLHAALALATALAVERLTLEPPSGADLSHELRGRGADQPVEPEERGPDQPDGSDGADPRVEPDEPRGADGPDGHHGPDERGAGGGAGRSRSRPGWAGPAVLVFLATLTRGESAFVAVGLAIGLIVVTGGGRRLLLPARARSGSPVIGRARAGLASIGRARSGMGQQLRGVMVLGVASAAALGLVAAVNVAFGQHLMPNSVLVKTFGDRGDTRRSLAGVMDRLTTDPWLLALLVLAAVVLVGQVRRRRQGPQLEAGGEGRGSRDEPPVRVSRALFPAVVVLVTGLLHVTFAAVVTSLRYESYVVVLGVWMLLRVLAELPEVAPAVARRARPATVLLLLVPLAGLQVRATLMTPHRMEETYEQRYQVARFLHQAYPHEPVAIGELGYIGLYHDGPLTDVYGLGDHEVLEATLEDRKDADFWADLQRRRGFEVVVAYSFALAGEEPDEWIQVAQWRSPGTYYETTWFWATTPEAVAPLQERLRAFEGRLPDSVEVSYNELAVLAAAGRIEGASP